MKMLKLIKAKMRLLNGLKYVRTLTYLFATSLEYVVLQTDNSGGFVTQG